MQYLLSFLLVAIGTLPVYALASAQVGFVDGLWFNTDTFTAGEPVRIYAAIRNHSGTDITGTVTFFVGEKTLTRQPVSALNNRVLEAWADWTPTVGTHDIRATFSDITLRAIGSTAEPLEDSTNLVARITVEPAPEPTPEAAPTSTAPTPTTAVPNSGLEAYLAPSRAQTILTAITDWSSSTRAQLEARRAPQPAHSSTSNTSILPDAVTTSTSGSTTTDLETIATSSSFWSDVSSVLKKIGSSFVDGVLRITIEVLRHPLLVQVGVLLGVLFGIYRTARYFGRRN